MNIGRYGFCTAVAVIFSAMLTEAGAGISATKHNLSVSGAGDIRAVSEQDVCIFCHIPHTDMPGASRWNRDTRGGYYTPYTSSTAVSQPGQPNGTSVLCLSCHDGTIALGDVISEETPINLLGGVTSMPFGLSHLGTDLSDDHPISLPYTSSLAFRRVDLVDPSTLTGAVRLDPSGQMQCTACHDPHEDSNGKFLTVRNRNGALCITCHGSIPHWSQSEHNQSFATWNGVQPDPWPDSSLSTVNENACGNCHRMHKAGGRERLLNHAVEEENCMPCHNGNVAKIDLADSLRKLSTHPVGVTTGVHDPAEPGIVDSRHVECEDCHNPHAARAVPGNLPGSLIGVRGISMSGTELDHASHEYEICFRCHADSTNKPAARTPRQIEQLNVRLEFSPSNPSYHPVAAIGKNQDVPSLLNPYTVNSTIGCSDCHDNDNSRASGGSGPNGPHGSNYAPILQMRYDALDNTPESPAAYALCYKCHDRNSILNDESFKSHRLHIVDQRTSCNACHDPHGVSAIQGNTLNNTSLINFDISIVQPNSLGKLRFESTGRFSGTCYLMCHGSDHAPKSY
ncbi:MAG: cytochrome c3 family protein [Candidatus Thiodiazotropha sp. (ex Dulcina madagascariensis)]|nr:cytochrome c3 family protein [Candidatus Thiodiazotropha sp. (ex Dulcina madagascariensis)]